jgi:hypothetical protein
LTVLAAEERRYIRKGYGLITACLQVFSFFYLMPHFGQWLWPRVLEM